MSETTSKILINTGPSPRGVHRLEQALICPQLYAYRHRLEKETSNKDALVKGSLLHVGLAHYYAQQRAVQRGEDPAAYHDPLPAIELASAEWGVTGTAWKALASQAVSAYMTQYMMEKFTIIGVEDLVETMIGPYRLTARWDLVTQDSQGKFWIYDHKSTGRIVAKTSERYTMALQFLAMQYMGREKFGDKFGGVRINLVGLTPVGHFHRTSPEAAPNALMRFPQIVEDAEAIIERYATRDPWDWPKAASEQVCQRPYGPCDYLDLCRWGD